MGKIYVSATALSTHSKCPHAFWLSRKYRSLAPPPSYFAEGSNVHKVMQGVATPMNDKTAAISDRLKKMEEELGYTVDNREFKQQFEIRPGMVVTRVMDVVGSDDEGPLLVDYKSAGSPWKKADGSGVAPLALSWQTVLYLYPTSGVEWPTRLMYLVAGVDFSQVFMVSRDEYRETELFALLDRIEQEKEHGHIREMGYGCQSCDYLAACYQTPGWQASYEKKGG